MQKYQAYNKILQEDLDIAEKGRKILRKRLTERQSYEKLIKQPQTSLKDIENVLKFTDKITLTALVNYLTIDSTELLKNITKVINRENADDIREYLNGALGRNDALIEMLKKHNIKKETFKNRITGKTEKIERKK